MAPIDAIFKGFLGFRDLQETHNLTVFGLDPSRPGSTPGHGFPDSGFPDTGTASGAAAGQRKITEKIYWPKSPSQRFRSTFGNISASTEILDSIPKAAAPYSDRKSWGGKKPPGWR